MKTKNCLITLFAVITLAIAGLFQALEAHGQGGEPDFYYVDNQKITLSVSKDFKAFALKPEVGPANMASFEKSVQATGIGEIEKSPILEKLGIVLIRSMKNVGPSAVMSAMESLSSRAEVETEVPVYSIGEANVVLTNEFIVQFKPDVSNASINEFVKRHRAKVVKRYEDIKNRYILAFEGKTPKEALAVSNAIYTDDLVIFSEPNFVQIIPARPEIKDSEPGSLSPSPAITTPNDPLFSKQWGLDNNGVGSGVADADIDAPEAWDIENGSNQVIIAIIDEGVDIQHPDLQGKIVTPYDATDGDNNQQPNAWDGHGTACAGIAAAMTNNGSGVAGVAWNVRIMPVRIASSNCRGCVWITSNAIIEDGLRTAVNRGAHVLSNSWGGGVPSNAITSAIDYAISNNRVAVFAAGNSAGPVIYPANLSSSRAIIAVSATNEWGEFKTKTSSDGEYWWGSNYGPEVNLAAPGVHIYTTDIHGTDGYVNGDYVATFNGTSSATPFVAGGAALVLSQNPSLGPAQVRNLLQKYSDDLGTPGFDNQFGYGRLNVAKVLSASILVKLDKAKYKIDEPGRTADAIVTVTNSGAPLAGKKVYFKTQDPTVASVSPAFAVTDQHGRASATVTGVANRKTTQLTATVGGAGDSAVVRVPDLSLAGVFFSIGCLVLVVILRKRNMSRPV